MFERFTETARRSLFFARFETTELGGLAIEAEHILLGLLRADKGPTPHRFAVAGLSYTDAKAEILAHCGGRPQVPTSVDLPLSDQTKRILQYAAEEADRLDQKYVGTGHLWVAVLRRDGSFAAEILRRHGMTLDDLREHMVEAPRAEREPDTSVDDGVLRVERGEHEPFDPVVSLERIRFLAEELVRSSAHVADARLLVDEIHYHLDALKRHLA